MKRRRSTFRLNFNSLAMNTIEVHDEYDEYDVELASFNAHIAVQRIWQSC